MQIFSLKIFVPAAEAVAHAQNALTKISAINDASVELVDNGVITRGRANLGLNIPFEALWHVAALATSEVVVTLVELKAGAFGMGGNMLADALMKLIAKKLDAIPGTRVEGRKIYADAAVVLKERLGVELRGVIHEFSITREGV